MEMKHKGFYFSFDALLALTVMMGTLILVHQSAEIAYDPFVADNIEYEEIRTEGQDAMSIAAQEDFSAYNDSFQQELLEETVMSEDDLERDILDGIALLWAARNFTHAEESVERYFDGYISEGNGYRLEVAEGGQVNTVFETSVIGGNPDAVSSSSRLVSGHRIDQPSEGFQAQARATEATAQDTSVYTFPPMGGALEGAWLDITREFEIDDLDEVENGTLHVSLHTGCDEADFNQLWLNGQNIQDGFEELHRQEQCDDRGMAQYGIVEGGPIVENLQEGTNTIQMSFRNSEYGAYIHPGMRLEIEKEREREPDTDLTEEQEIPFNDMVADEQGNRGTGGFATNMFELPQDAELEDLEITLRAENIDRVHDEDWVSGCGTGNLFDEVSDIMVFFNDEEVYSSIAPEDGEVHIEFDEDDLDVIEGTNIITAYFNSYADCAWGSDETRIVGSAEEEEYSKIEVSYEREEDELEFGRIDVTHTEEFGGTVDHPMERDFQIDHEIVSSFVHLGKLFSASVEVGVEGDTVRRTEEPRAVPSRVFIGPENYVTGQENTIMLNDHYHDPGHVRFVPESTLEKTVNVPSHVGYGGLFPNETAALEDAERRLEGAMGEHAGAASIEDEILSTGDQPYIWGPGEVRLVVWRE